MQVATATVLGGEGRPMHVEYVRTIYSTPDQSFRVLSLMRQGGSPLTAVLTVPYPFRPGEVLDIDGKWVMSPKYGKQFRISSMSPKDGGISSVAGLEAYLSAGAIAGVGPVLAARIVKEFGEKTADALGQPGLLAKVHGIGPETAAKIAEAWLATGAPAQAILRLMELGLSAALAGRALKRFGPQAAEVAKADPYGLLAVRGIGFVKADELAKKMGVAPDHPKRIAAGTAHVLEQATAVGHCFLPEKELTAKGTEVLGLADASVLIKELEEMADRGAVIRAGDRWYLPEIHKAERAVESGLLALMSRAKKPDSRAENLLAATRGLTPEQLNAIGRAVRNRLTVITGAPGTGKTYATKRFVEILEACGTSYALAAPTGKAAKRLAESTGRNASTIHRLLEYSPERGFGCGPGKPIDAEYVVVDEMSMVDIQLMESLLLALSGTASLVLIGDPNQLPAVGPGNVLRDVIAGGVCHVTTLTQIQRQAESSRIIKAAHAIIRGEAPLNVLAPSFQGGSPVDAVFIEEEDAGKARDVLLDLLPRLPPGTQVLAPMKKGTLGVAELNAAIRQIVNPGGLQLGGFRDGDRVIQMVNNYDKDVFNGEVGHVAGVNAERGTLSVDFGDRKIDYGVSDLDELSLAYCLTIHKAQGSEFPCVVVPLHTQHYIMLRRELLYTAVTRASKLLVLVGSYRALRMAVKNSQEQSRHTGLFQGGK